MMKYQRVKGIGRWMKGAMLKRLHGMITCREFENFILGYLDDELPPRQRKVFEFHMRICRECRQYLAAYKRSIEIGQSVLSSADQQVLDEVPDDLIRAILDAREK